jgi:hypothetical protein
MIRAYRRFAQFTSLLLCASVISFGLSAKGITVATNDNAPAEGIVILKSNDPLPANARVLQTIQVGDKIPSDNCDYLQLMESVRVMALKSNANVIKINERTARNKANICDKITATLYKVENPRRYESEFSWTPNRKLTWDDFRGPIQSELHPDVAAATFCGIGFETNTITSKNNQVKIRVYNNFYPTQSWVRPGQEIPEILAHEQTHFDICELYTRKLRQRLDNVSVSVTNLRTRLSAIYQQVQEEYKIRQQQYEDETEHGLIADEQVRWQNMINKELASTTQWMQ